MYTLTKVMLPCSNPFPPLDCFKKGRKLVHVFSFRFRLRLGTVRSMCIGLSVYYTYADLSNHKFFSKITTHDKISSYFDTVLWIVQA